MDRQYYLDLSAQQLRMPVGADLVLHQHPDHKAILSDGKRLGQVLLEAAELYNAPMALPIMDLSLEKSALLDMLGIDAAQKDTFHFDAPPSDQQMAMVQSHLSDPYDPRLQANIDAITYTIRHSKRIPVGMTIGPFSMMTKLLADPITPLYIAASGVTAKEDAEVELVERALELADMIISRSLKAQLEAGAKIIFVAEPASNSSFLSPNQIEAGSDIFDRYVIAHNQKIKKMLEQYQADLYFHCCGELTDYMVKKFCELDPAVLSLGSGRGLWEFAQMVPNRTVLYGNLPTKKFYSDDLVSVPQAEQMTRDLMQKMRATGHSFILGSECDILSVPGCEKKIMDKVMAMIHCTI